jgi:hypothetical protein
MNLTERQKQTLISAVIGLVILIAGLFGYEARIAPAQPAPTIEFGAESVSGPRFLNARLNGQTYATALSVNSLSFATPPVTAAPTATPVLPSAATSAGTVFAATNTLANTQTTNKTMFVVPANADIVDVYVIVTTVFNDSGTDLIECGKTSGTPTEYVNDLSGAVTGLTRAGAAGTMPVTNFGDVGGSNVTVLCKYVGQNANSSTGAATVTLYYRID